MGERGAVVLLTLMTYRVHGANGTKIGFTPEVILNGPQTGKPAHRL